MVKFIPTLSKNDISRFLACVPVMDKDECWIWSGRVLEKRYGYGRFSLKSKYYSAHRISYFHFKGIDPMDGLVCHQCDRPACVNPNHLFVGSHADNTRDMIRKGRYRKGFVARGEQCVYAKVTESQVCEIRRSYTGKRGEQTALAKKFGISVGLVWTIVRRKSWRHVA